MRASLVMLIVLAVCASSAQARIYTCKDKAGNTVYSDSPSSELCPEAEEVAPESLPPLIESKPLLVPRSTNTKANASNQDANSSYQSLAITSPNDQENLRSNEGQVLIAYKVLPELDERGGHQYVVILGDKEVYRGKNNSVALENVDRGDHTVTAKIISPNGQTLISSNTVQFTLHRFSELQGNLPGEKSPPVQPPRPPQPPRPLQPPPPPPPSSRP